MLIRWLISTYLLAEVWAQRGDWSGDRGGWDDSQAQQVVTETQMQTRTLVSTAPARPPTTVVQATTVLRVSTIQVQAQPSTITLTADGRTITTTTSLTPSPSLSTMTLVPSPVVNSQNASADELTVDPLHSPSATSSGSSSTRLTSNSTSVGSASSTASLATAPTTSDGATTATPLTDILPDISGVEVETTGTPYMRDGGEGVVYGHIANNGATALRIPLTPLIFSILAVLWTISRA